MPRPRCGLGISGRHNSVMKARWIGLGLALLIGGCGRYFPGPIVPKATQSEWMTVHDDGTVSHAYERLEISLRPLSDDELNRAFPQQSTRGAESTNPYTYGDWSPLGDAWTPPRFTVFLLKIKNYAYPKVKIDPQHIELRSDNGRLYRPLSLLELSEYYRAHALAWAGNFHGRYREQSELLRRTMYDEKMIFSGQEDEGYVIFPVLAPDVTRMAVALGDVAVRFDYADEPVERFELTYQFEREVHRGYQPPAALVSEGP